MTDGNNEINKQKIPKIELFFTPVGVVEDSFKGYRVVVIDVLRASTSIITALANGTRYIIPAATISGATELSTQLGREAVLLCGERDGKIVDGFDLGNSPLEYKEDKVRGKTIIFGSTNGAPAIAKAAHADLVMVASFINLTSVVETLIELDDPFPLAILCAGNKGKFALEDGVCGGMLINRLLGKYQTELALNDAAKSAEILAKNFGHDIPNLLRSVDHGKYLIQLGMEQDLDVCAEDSVIKLVPALRDGKLVEYQESK